MELALTNQHLSRNRNKNLGRPQKEKVERPFSNELPAEHPVDADEKTSPQSSLSSPRRSAIANAFKES
ncbi:MAG: hypothetical protein ACR2RE_07380 [Geminicoccaceae bacterium]